MTTVEQLLRVAAARIGFARPVYAHYGVTHRCNMRCRMCAVWKGADAAAELSVPEVTQLVQILRGAGVRTVALGGGEPFVRDDLPGVIAAFDRDGFEVRLLTNGIGLSDRQIDDVVAAGLNHVSISLDSVKPEMEEYIYNGQDVWDDIVDSMRRFRARLTSRRSILIMNVCVSRLNLDELPLLVNMAGDERYFCSFVPVALASDEQSSDGFAGVAPDLAVRPEDHGRLKAAYAELLRLKRNGAPIANSSRFLSDSAHYLRRGGADWSCDAGRLYLSVSPEGDISICHRFAPVANARDADAARKLRSVVTRREAQQQRETCPGCMRPCWAEVTHAMRNLGSGWEAFRSISRLSRIS